MSATPLESFQEIQTEWEELLRKLDERVRVLLPDFDVELD